MSRVPISEDFLTFMRDALYGEQGFYTLGGGAGRDRDYVTSPEVGDLFGFVIAGYIDKWFASVDGDRAIVVEAGCGPGSLAASIARSSMQCKNNIDYYLVDVSPEHRKIAEEKLTRVDPEFSWSVHDVIPECDVPTLVISNELLDNLVFNIGNVHDSYQRQESEALTPTPLAALGRFTSTDNLSRSGVPADIGNFRIPLHVGIYEWLVDLVEATSNVTDLSLLFFDYMKSVRAFEDGQWLRLYSNNQRIVGIDEVLSALEAGQRGDITTDVTIEDLDVMLDGEGFSKITFTSQASWLYQNDVDEYVSSVSSSPYDQLQQMVQGKPGDVGAASFAIERETLMDEAGLGAFTVVTARREI